MLFARYYCDSCAELLSAWKNTNIFQIDRIPSPRRQANRKVKLAVQGRSMCNIPEIQKKKFNAGKWKGGVDRWEF